jgi:hypothetical protein
MKIKHYIFSLILLSIIITSCKKEEKVIEEPKKNYTCECTYSISLLGQTTTGTQTYSYPNTTNTIATDSCNARETELINDIQPLGGTVSCTLK